MIGKVGDDTFGHLLTGTLKAHHIDTQGVRVDASVFTTLAFVSLDATGNRDFSFARKPGADTCLTPEEIPESLFEGARVFHFGTLSLTHEPARSATEQALKLAHKHRLLVSLDPNLRKPLWPDEQAARDAMEWSLRQAHIVKISDEEVDFLWHLSPEEGAQRLIEEYGVSLCYVTLGPKGAYARNASHAVCVPAPEGITPVDTTGAGYIFGGSAMSQLLQTGKVPEDLTEEELSRIVRFASTAASLSTLTHGGVSSLPAKEAVLACLSQD